MISPAGSKREFTEIFPKFFGRTRHGSIECTAVSAVFTKFPAPRGRLARILRPPGPRFAADSRAR